MYLLPIPKGQSMETVQLVPAGTVTLGDLTVAYYDSGTEAPDTDPIVLVHGSAGSTAEHFGFLFPPARGPTPGHLGGPVRAGRS